MQDVFDTERLKDLAGKLKRSFYASPKNIVTYFVSGLIIIIPLVVTLWILVWIFNLVDGMLYPVLAWGFGRPMPGLGFVIIITAVVLIGYFGIKSRRRRAFSLFEMQVIKIPIVGAIYGNTRQILESFSTSDGRFLEVVFIEFPRKGIYTVGLVTSEVEDRNGKKVFNIFIPTAPNPTSGFLQIVPESDIVRSSMSVNDALKLVISAGKVSHADIASMLLEVPEPKRKGKMLKPDL